MTLAPGDKPPRWGSTRLVIAVVGVVTVLGGIGLLVAAGLNSGSDEVAGTTTTTTTVTTTTSSTTTSSTTTTVTTTTTSTTVVSDVTTTSVPEGSLGSEDAPSCAAAELPVDAVLVDGYRQLDVCGWQVFMHDDLYGDELALEVYAALADDMQMVIDVAPAPAVVFLRDTNIWLELDEPSVPGGVYHPSAQWLSDNGFPTKWAEGIQIGNARNFLDWTAQQPAMLLHEFTHALHHQIYDFDQRDVDAAYDAAMQAGSYDSVEYVEGGFREAYATSNSIEYLAELSEAYYWVNDFYPFDREQLAAHDPAGMAAVELMWEMS